MKKPLAVHAPFPKRVRDANLTITSIVSNTPSPDGCGNLPQYGVQYKTMDGLLHTDRPTLELSAHRSCRVRNGEGVAESVGNASLHCTVVDKDLFNTQNECGVHSANRLFVAVAPLVMVVRMHANHLDDVEWSGLRYDYVDTMKPTTISIVSGTTAWVASKPVMDDTAPPEFQPIMERAVLMRQHAKLIQAMPSLVDKAFPNTRISSAGAPLLYVAEIPCADGRHKLASVRLSERDVTVTQYVAHALGLPLHRGAYIIAPADYPLGLQLERLMWCTYAKVGQPLVEIREYHHRHMDMWRYVRKIADGKGTVGELPSVPAFAQRTKTTLKQALRLYFGALITTPTPASATATAETQETLRTVQSSLEDAVDAVWVVWD